MTAGASAQGGAGPVLPGEKRSRPTVLHEASTTLLAHATEVQLVRELVRRTRWMYLDHQTLRRFDPHGVAPILHGAVHQGLGSADANGGSHVAA